MIGLLCFALAVLASPFKSKVRLEAENTVLRHQLIVLRRSLPGRVRLPIAPWSATVLFGTVIGFAEDLSVSDAHRVKLSIVFERLVHADVSIGCGSAGAAPSREDCYSAARLWRNSSFSCASSRSKRSVRSRV